MSIFRPLLEAISRLYRRLVQRRLDTHTRELAEILQDVPALTALSSSSRFAMAAATHRRTYRRGESIYYEGDPGLGLYIVESGRVQLKTFGESDRPHELRVIEPHGLFGSLALLGDVRRLETAEAVTETRVLGFFRPDLKNIVRRDPKAAADICLTLSRHVAAQQVELLRQIEERDGRLAALETYAAVAANTGADGPSGS